MKALMLAGEVSGDYQGAHLARALRALAPDLELIGTGGRHMIEAGVRVSHETTHLGSVGFLEPIRQLWPIQRLFGGIRRLVRRERPDVAVLIDNMGFNLAVGRILRAMDVPVVFYFPPQIWAGDFLFGRSVARVSRLVISAFPREAELYRSRHGANAVSFGHPLLDIVRVDGTARAALRRTGLDPDRPLIGLMPGSRGQEVRALGKAMLDAVGLIRRRHPAMQFLLPVAAPHLRPPLERMLAERGLSGEVTLVMERAYDCLSHCAVVMACTGTATLELALLGTPMVTAYRLDPFSYWLACRLTSTPYVALPNLLLNAPAVPEIIQHGVSGEHFAARTLALYEDPDGLATQRRRLASVRDHLGENGAIGLAARRILDELGARPGIGGR